MKIIKKIINIILVLIPVVAIIYVGINAESISGIIDEKEKELKASTITEQEIDKSKWEYKGNICIGYGDYNMKFFYNHLDEFNSKYFYLDLIDKWNMNVYEVGKNQLEAVYSSMKDLPYWSDYQRNQPSRKDEVYDADVVKDLTAKSIQRSFNGSASDLRKYKTSGRAKEFVRYYRSGGFTFLDWNTILLDYYDINDLEIKCSDVNISSIGVAENTCDIGGLYLLAGTMELETLNAKDGFKGNEVFPKEGEKKTVRFIYSGRCINGIVKQMRFLNFNAGF